MSEETTNEFSLTKKEKAKQLRYFNKSKLIHEKEKLHDAKYLQEMADKLFKLREKKSIWGFDPSILICEYMNAWEKKDEDTMLDVLTKAEQRFEIIVLQQNKDSIKEILDFCNADIENILKQIKTSNEAELVTEALISTEHITSLPKGYSQSKKDKVTFRNKKKVVPTTYEHALRRNRHMLESDLSEIGVGQQRARKISQILQYL